MMTKRKPLMMDLCQEKSSCSMGAAIKLNDPLGSRLPLEVALGTGHGDCGAGDDERQGKLKNVPDGAGITICAPLETRLQLAELAGISRPDQAGHRLTVGTVRIHPGQQGDVAGQVQNLITEAIPGLPLDFGWRQVAMDRKAMSKESNAVTRDLWQCWVKVGGDISHADLKAHSYVAESRLIANSSKEGWQVVTVDPNRLVYSALVEFSRLQHLFGDEVSLEFIKALIVLYHARFSTARLPGEENIQPVSMAHNGELRDQALFRIMSSIYHDLKRRGKEDHPLVRAWPIMPAYFSDSIRSARLVSAFTHLFGLDIGDALSRGVQPIFVPDADETVRALMQCRAAWLPQIAGPGNIATYDVTEDADGEKSTAVLTCDPNSLRPGVITEAANGLVTYDSVNGRCDPFLDKGEVTKDSPPDGGELVIVRDNGITRGHESQKEIASGGKYVEAVESLVEMPKHSSLPERRPSAEAKLTTRQKLLMVGVLSENIQLATTLAQKGSPEGGAMGGDLQQTPGASFPLTTFISRNHCQAVAPAVHGSLMKGYGLDITVTLTPRPELSETVTVPKLNGVRSHCFISIEQSDWLLERDDAACVRAIWEDGELDSELSAKLAGWDPAKAETPEDVLVMFDQIPELESAFAPLVAEVVDLARNSGKTTIVLDNEPEVETEVPMPAVFVTAGLMRGLEKEGLYHTVSAVGRFLEVTDGWLATNLLIMGLKAVVPVGFQLYLEDLHVNNGGTNWTEPFASATLSDVITTHQLGLESEWIGAISALGTPTSPGAIGTERLMYKGFDAETLCALFDRSEEEAHVRGHSFESLMRHHFARVKRALAVPEQPLVELGLLKQPKRTKDEKLVSRLDPVQETQSHVSLITSTEVLSNNDLIAAFAGRGPANERFANYYGFGINRGLFGSPISLGRVADPALFLPTIQGASKSFGALSPEGKIAENAAAVIQQQLLEIAYETGDREIVDWVKAALKKVVVHSGEGGMMTKKLAKLKELLGGSRFRETINEWDYPMGNSFEFASGCFGWDILSILGVAEELEVKLAQGAKAGKGGNLPAYKVKGIVALIRNLLPGIPSPSPPMLPYWFSIEDGKKLNEALRTLFSEVRHAPIWAKLAAKSPEAFFMEALGVIKDGYDLSVSGNGGTASALWIDIIASCAPSWFEPGMFTQIKTTELGIRPGFKMRAEGNIRHGLDLLFGHFAGFDEFGIGMLKMVGDGCILAGVCHNNTCPKGVASHDPVRRAMFDGSPLSVSRVDLILVQQLRVLLAMLGKEHSSQVIGLGPDVLVPKERGAYTVRSFDEGVVPSEPKERRFQGSKPKEQPDPVLDLAKSEIGESKIALAGQNHSLKLQRALTPGEEGVGTAFVGWLAKHTGYEGLPKDSSVTVETNGAVGDFFGAFLLDRMTMRHTGVVGSFCGFGMQEGGEVHLMRPKNGRSFLASSGFGIGKQGGSLFAAGRIGHNAFACKRGGNDVIEGVGDNALQFASRGFTVITGDCAFGTNLGAGMNLGLVCLRDTIGLLENSVSGSLKLVHLNNPAEMEEFLGQIREGELPLEDQEWYLNATDSVYELIAKHREKTGSRLTEGVDSVDKLGKADFVFGVPMAVWNYKAVPDYVEPDPENPVDELRVLESHTMDEAIAILKKEGLATAAGFPGMEEKVKSQFGSFLELA